MVMFWTTTNSTRMKSRHHLWTSWRSPGKNIMISTYHAINCNYVIITLPENKTILLEKHNIPSPRPILFSYTVWSADQHCDIYEGVWEEHVPRNPSLGWFNLTEGQADGPTCVHWTQATESSQAPPTPWRQFSRSCGGKLVLLKHCQLAAADKQAPSQSSTHSAVSGTILEHVGEMAANHFSNISADISSLTGHFWYRVPCTRTL